MAMAEMLNIRVIETDEELTIPDVEPTASAELFWRLSDEIWRQKPEQSRLAFFSVASAIPTVEARDALNEALVEIDEELVVSGIGKAIKIGGFRPDAEVELTPELLDNPAGSQLGTFNWDEHNISRIAYIEGEKKHVVFTDDHKDRHRELYAGFDYRDENNSTVQLTYSMQRIQHAQDHPTSLNMNIWHSRFAETGYEGNHLKSVPLSIEQELSVLKVFQAMGGITLEATTQDK